VDSSGPPSSIFSRSESSEVLSALSLSPAPSHYSLTDSLRVASKHVEYGREVNSYSDVYRLPADTAEISRLDKQHYMFKDVMGDYCPHVKEVLNRSFTQGDEDEQIAVLDVGCGSGAWIVDVAHEFPNTSCVAVDLVPMPAEIVPSNCRYEVDDVNLGLDHYEGQFDVVHCRLISSGIKDYYGVIRDAAACLRAGGVAEFMEFDFRLYTRQHIAVPTTQKEIWGNTTPPPDFPSAGFLNLAPRTTKSSRSGLMRPTSSPYIARWFAALGQASRKRGGHADAASLIHSWVSANPSYEDVQYRDFWLPYGPWMRGRPEYMALSQYDRFCTIGDLMREDIFEFIRSGRPLLLSAGFPECIVNRLETEANREVSEARIPLFFRIQNVYARKKA